MPLPALLRRALVLLLGGTAACGNGSRRQPQEYRRLRGPELEEARALYRAGEPARGAEILRAMMRDPLWEVRRHAVSTAGAVRDSALAGDVAGALADPSADVRESASRVLASIGGPESADPLRRALSDPVPIVRSNAAEALARTGGLGTAALLAQLLRTDPDSSVRAITASTLGELGDRGSVPHLVAALADRAPVVRVRAATALGQLGDPAARPALEAAAARDPDEQVRRRAAAALAALAGGATP